MSKTSDPHGDQVIAVPSDEVSNLKSAVRKDGIQQQGLKIERHFTTPELDPFDEIAWEVRDAAIYDEKGGVIFEKKGVEVPASWSQLSTDIVASKYFRRAGVPQVD